MPSHYAIVPPLVHLMGADCYQSMPGDGGNVPDLDGAAKDYERCPRCFPGEKMLKEPVADKMLRIPANKQRRRPRGG